LTLENLIKKLTQNKWVRNGLLVTSALIALDAAPVYAHPHKHRTESTLTDTTISDTISEESLNVYLDVYRSYQNSIKTSIPFVNYVRDPDLADIHIRMSSQRTGGGGREYLIEFNGLQEYESMDQILTYTSENIETRATRRRGLVNMIKVGLVPYFATTHLADNIGITFEGDIEPVEIVDEWDSWVFNINGEGSLSGEESRSRGSLAGSISADRVTSDWKISQSVSSMFDRRVYTLDDEATSNISSRYSYRGFLVKSLGDHFSVGFFNSLNSSTYSNTNLSLEFSPAFEFNIFPYSESSNRQFRITYTPGYEGVRYDEETIYGKMSENLFKQELATTFEMEELWGSAGTTLRGSHYFHDLDKNRIELDGNLSLRLSGGISLTFRGGISRIHDQLSLSKGDASDEDILLNIRQLATQYEYNVSLGLRYTFGSVYSHVVNPRFGI
jgi:hypothetical protein